MFFTNMAYTPTCMHLVTYNACTIPINGFGELLQLFQGTINVVNIIYYQYHSCDLSEAFSETTISRLISKSNCTQEAFS